MDLDHEGEDYDEQPTIDADDEYTWRRAGRNKNTEDETML